MFRMPDRCQIVAYGILCSTHGNASPMSEFGYKHKFECGFFSCASSSTENTPRYICALCTIYIYVHCVSCLRRLFSVKSSGLPLSTVRSKDASLLYTGVHRDSNTEDQYSQPSTGNGPDAGNQRPPADRTYAVTYKKDRMISVDSSSHPLMEADDSANIAFLGSSSAGQNGSTCSLNTIPVGDEASPTHDSAADYLKRRPCPTPQSRFDGNADTSRYVCTSASKSSAIYSTMGARDPLGKQRSNSRLAAEEMSNCEVGSAGYIASCQGDNFDHVCIYDTQYAANNVLRESCQSANGGVLDSGTKSCPDSLAVKVPGRAASVDMSTQSSTSCLDNNLNELSDMLDNDRLVHDDQYADPSNQMTCEDTYNRTYCCSPREKSGPASLIISNQYVLSPHSFRRSTARAAASEAAYTSSNATEEEYELHPDESVCGMAWQNLASKCGDDDEPAFPGHISYVNASGNINMQAATGAPVSSGTHRVSLLSNMAKKLWSRRPSRTSQDPQASNQHNTIDSTVAGGGAWDVLRDQTAGIGRRPGSAAGPSTQDGGQELYAILGSAISNDADQHTRPSVQTSTSDHYGVIAQEHGGRQEPLNTGMAGRDSSALAGVTGRGQKDDDYDSTSRLGEDDYHTISHCASTCGSQKSGDQVLANSNGDGAVLGVHKTLSGYEKVQKSAAVNNGQEDSADTNDDGAVLGVHKTLSGYEKVQKSAAVNDGQEDSADTYNVMSPMSNINAGVAMVNNENAKESFYTAFARGSTSTLLPELPYVETIPDAAADYNVLSEPMAADCSSSTDDHRAEEEGIYSSVDAHLASKPQSSGGKAVTVRQQQQQGVEQQPASSQAAPQHMAKSSAAADTVTNDCIYVGFNSATAPAQKLGTAALCKTSEVESQSHGQTRIKQ